MDILKRLLPKHCDMNELKMMDYQKIRSELVTRVGKISITVIFHYRDRATFKRSIFVVGLIVNKYYSQLGPLFQ